MHIGWGANFMQLKIQRSQRTGGLTGTTVFFNLDVRADYSPEEAENIRRYKLGSQVIYNSRAAKKHLDSVNANLERSHANSVGDQFAGIARGAFSLALAKMSLNITIASLGRGHHIECKDLDELLEAEDTVRTACKNVTRYLDVAATFDGSEMVVEYEGGEERVHIAQSTAPIITYAATAPPTVSEPLPAAQTLALAAPVAATGTSETFRESSDGVPSAGAALKEHWLAIERRILAFTESQGWNVDEFQVRLVCGAGTCLVLIVLWNIF
jgi:hypothetical protein